MTDPRLPSNTSRGSTLALDPTGLTSNQVAFESPLKALLRTVPRSQLRNPTPRSEPVLGLQLALSMQFASSARPQRVCARSLIFHSSPRSRTAFDLSPPLDDEADGRVSGCARFVRGCRCWRWLTACVHHGQPLTSTGLISCRA